MNVNADYNIDDFITTNEVSRSSETAVNLKCFYSFTDKQVFL